MKERWIAGDIESNERDIDRKRRKNMDKRKKKDGISSVYKLE